MASAKKVIRRHGDSLPCRCTREASVQRWSAQNSATSFESAGVESGANQQSLAVAGCRRAVRRSVVKRAHRDARGQVDLGPKETTTKERPARKLALPPSASCHWTA